ncbi:MAG: four helix bundle protein [Thermodesulfobacteriota bacterium]
MGNIKSFEDLDVWQEGKKLVLKTYVLTNDFPKEEAYGMTSQVRRAALSIPANIAEGFGRYHFMDKAKFYLNARGSLYELKSHLLIARELGFIKDGIQNDVFQIIEDLGLRINNLIGKTRSMKDRD